MSLRARVLTVSLIVAAVTALTGVLVLSRYTEARDVTAQILDRVPLTAEDSADLESAAAATRQLAWALGAATVMALALPLLAWLALRSQVLGPLDRLRAQIRHAATPGQHESVITPDGPPEIHQVGVDAESMRRALVREMDESDAADEALGQEVPVVDAIRRELSARADGPTPGVEVVGVLRPAEGVLGGDFWDRFVLPDGRVAVLLCDVSGHGPRAGIVAMRLKTALTLGLVSGADPTEVLHRVCDTFADEPGRFATVVLMVIDPTAGTLAWINAGHPSPRLVRADGTLQRLDPTGPMVSWLVGAWEFASTALGAGDICLAFSDGILESRDGQGAELGDEALDAVLTRACADAPDAAEASARVLAAVRVHADDLGRDDVTLVAARLDPVPTL